MSDYQAGFEAFSQHQNCALFEGFAPARTLEGEDAIRFHLPAEDQGTALIQMARPHDRWYQEWVRGWNDARLLSLDSDPRS